VAMGNSRARQARRPPKPGDPSGRFSPFLLFPLLYIADERSLYPGSDPQHQQARRPVGRRGSLLRNPHRRAPGFCHKLLPSSPFFFLHLSSPLSLVFFLPNPDMKIRCPADSFFNPRSACEERPGGRTACASVWKHFFFRFPCRCWIFVFFDGLSSSSQTIIMVFCPDRQPHSPPFLAVQQPYEP